MIGLSIPVGRLEADAMRGVASIAESLGGGTLRLTAWQNLLLTDIPSERVRIACATAEALGFGTTPSPATDGIIACTGSRGCKYAASDTKGAAVALIRHLRGRIEGMDTPVSLHFTGCAHSCAQHYCGDLGFIATKLPDGSEGYHVVVGGGMDDERGIARDLLRNLPAARVTSWTEAALRAFLGARAPGESFHRWAGRLALEELRAVLPAIP
jgi:ferredoxin-nitrite reductase